MDNQRLRVLIIGGIALLAVIGALVVFRLIPGRKPPGVPPADLVFWGVADDELVWQETINRFREQYPSVTIAYRRIDERGYESFLINRLAEGRGPDIFMLKNSWVAKHRDKIFPLPQESLDFGGREFAQTFVDGAGQDLLLPDGSIIGMPLVIDTLALFYNKDIFNAKGVAQPPATWEEFARVAAKLSGVSPTGDVSESGAALGTFRNVSHAFEILSGLMLQSGDPIIRPGSRDPALGRAAAEALSFYASFADPGAENFSWTSRKNESLAAFAQGEAAMAFGFARDVPAVLGRNPRLALGVAPFPQFADAAPAHILAPAEYYFPTVSRASPAPAQAWFFLLFASSPEIAAEYSGRVGIAPARRDLVERAPSSDLLHAFRRQALIARFWSVPDEAGAERLFGEAIESVNNRSRSVAQALEILRGKITFLIP